MSVIKITEVGRVKKLKKNIVTVTGLSCFMNGQILRFASGMDAIIVGFNKEDIVAFVLGDECKVKVGEEVYSRQEELKIPVGERFIGRIVNALAEPMDGKGPIQRKNQRFRESECYDTLTLDTRYPIFREAPATMDRGSFDSCFESGTKIIDAVTPIAKGQRQLIIGDRMVGKTTIAVDAILNQKDKGVICIYCSIGKSFSSLLKTIRIFNRERALDYTIVVVSLASATVGAQYLAPYSACSLGEYFMYNNRDVLVVFDDLTKHAWAYRQLSLLLERPPGREAYPGDIYYVHSQLIERGGKLNEELGGGSMTFLLIADTLEGDVTGLIPSNLISMADGQIYLNTALFTENFKPAIDFSLSFSSIGSRVQNSILKDLAKEALLEYSRYKELVQLIKIKSNLTTETNNIIRRGQILDIIFCQDKNSPVSIEELIVLLYAFSSKVLDELDMVKISRFKDDIWGYITRYNSKLAAVLVSAKELTSEIKEELDKVFVEYFNSNQKPVTRGYE